MKKTILSIIAMLVLVTMLAVPAMAAEGTVALSDATGASGEVVTVTVSLAGFEQATALGITYTGVPEMVNEASKWELTGGMLSDIGNEQKNVSVWAASNPTTVNGDVLKLALRLPAYDGTRAYTIEVKVKVQSNATLLGEVTKTATVTVNNPAQSVTLDKTSLALDLTGTKTGTLTATAAPDTTTDTVVWASSDSAVASVENGVVTAKKPGTATITATAGTKSASCTVTVTCSHANAVKTDPKAATCEATGNNAYYTCGDCNQVLKADKKTVTTVAAETLATVPHSGGTATCTAQAVCSMCSKPYGDKKAHSFSKTWSSDANQHWHICTTCNTEKGSVAAHSFSWKVDKPATEDKTGLKHEECACGYKRNENTVIPKLDHVHVNIKRVAPVKATCTKTGTVEHWTCGSSKCAGKFYGDAKCQILLSTTVAPIDANNHSGKGSYQSDENQHWQVCSDCKGIMGEKKNHNFSWWTDAVATENNTGLKHEVCSVCKAKRNENTVIPKLPHAPAKAEGKPATCTTAGVAEHFYCPNCGNFYASDNGNPGAQIKKDDTTIPALGHSFGTEWVGDEKGHWHVCTVCEGKSEVEAHTLETVDAVEATEQTEGFTGDQVCTVCKTVAVKGEVIPVIVPETTAAPTAPQTVGAEEGKNDPVLIASIAVVALAAIGGGAFLLVKKPWKK